MKAIIYMKFLKKKTPNMEYKKRGLDQMKSE